MKKALKILLTIIGGILIMITLNGCRTLNSSVPENRTEEEYVLENSFKPFFDFLAAEKKDLSTVQEYSSYLLEQENPSSTLQHHKIDLERKGNVLEGNYNIGYNDGEPNSTLYKVIYENEHLNYLEEVPQEYDMRLFNLQIHEGVFRKLPIISIQKDHPETTLQTITYKANDDLDFVKEIKENYNIKSKSYVSITLTNRGYGEFSVDISIEAENGQYISVLNHIDFKETGEE
ncbi:MULTISPECIES: hypothetical protein [Streptococcus]|uniref:Lipoprotein n=1 Tax=Streptococcus sanguinis TaxID=1305 RepID=A0A3P1S4M5_STRSA|nr:MULTISPECIES: hypothetical protein [Streptococcus]MBF1721137.1 hypothetical protein [Streptococcus sp.]RRC91162.1 hypothetical protein EII39_09410 [Streptococcus sanguinis]